VISHRTDLHTYARWPGLPHRRENLKRWKV
jgi:hypothetical protein